jgi:hypothetical protein
MPSRRPDPLQAATRLLVDGTNLLYALNRGAPQPAPLPAPAVVGRLRALVPPGVAVVVVLDGAPAPGARDRRLVAGVDVRYAGRRPADALLRELVAAGHAGTLAVTDDRELAAELRALGADVAATSWLASLLARQRLGAPAAGRPTAPAATPPPEVDEDRPRPGWQPGRGATVKRGNPRRRRRAR